MVLSGPSSHLQLRRKRAEKSHHPIIPLGVSAVCWWGNVDLPSSSCDHLEISQHIARNAPTPSTYPNAFSRGRALKRWISRFYDTNVQSAIGAIVAAVEACEGRTTKKTNIRIRIHLQEQVLTGYGIYGGSKLIANTLDG